jgi:hypothetical protein
MSWFPSTMACAATLNWLSFTLVLRVWIALRCLALVMSLTELSPMKRSWSLP